MPYTPSKHFDSNIYAPACICNYPIIQSCGSMIDDINENPADTGQELQSIYTPNIRIGKYVISVTLTAA